MPKLCIDELLTYHTHWKKYLLPDEAYKYISISRKLIHKVIDTDGEISGITLSFPEECSDYQVYSGFLDVLHCNYSTKETKTGIITTFN